MALNFPHHERGSEFGDRYGTKRAYKRSYAFLAIECPECHAPAGSHCSFGAGKYGVAHRVRREKFEVMNRRELPDAL